MTQVESLSVVAYGIGVFLLIIHLKMAYPDVTQHWYAYDASALGIFDNIELYFNLLNVFVPGRRYFKPSI